MSERMSDEQLRWAREGLADPLPYSNESARDEISRLINHIDALRAELAKAERERDSAREALAELAQIVGETDHDHSNVENEPCPVCCCLIQANHTLAALKPTQAPEAA